MSEDALINGNDVVIRWSITADGAFIRLLITGDDVFIR